MAPLKWMVRFLTAGLLVATGTVQAAGSSGTSNAFNGAAAIKHSCTRCHRAAVVRAQRLSREEWDQELQKMEAMGARIDTREALLNYLAKTYGDAASGTPTAGNETREK